MKVLLTGASGFVGAAIRDALLESGHSVVAPARRAGSRPSIPGLVWKEADFMKATDSADWAALVEGVDAIVNAVGIIRETSQLKFQQVHADAPRALFTAGVQAGVSRFVQVSASGVTADSRLEYYSSKAQTDALMREKYAERSLILRPSLIYGENGEATQLFRRLSTLPVVPLPAGGHFTFRPVLVLDLARTVADALAAQPFSAGVFEVGGADVLSLREMLLAIRAWSKGAPKGSPQWTEGPTMSVPLPLMKPAALAGDLTGRGPLDSTMLKMMVESQAQDITPFVERFGNAPRGLRTYLMENPR